VTGWNTTSDDMEADCNPDACSDPAHVEFPPRPMVNNAMASARAAITKTFATAM
jgi:hypothetical protein